MTDPHEIAISIMNGLKIEAPCTCAQDDHTPDCAYTREIDANWEFATAQAAEIVQDVDLIAA
jgi:hypothetical protein